MPVVPLAAPDLKLLSPYLDLPRKCLRPNTTSQIASSSHAGERYSFQPRTRWVLFPYLLFPSCGGPTSQSLTHGHDAATLQEKSRKSHDLKTSKAPIIDFPSPISQVCRLSLPLDLYRLISLPYPSKATNMGKMHKKHYAVSASFVFGPR